MDCVFSAYDIALLHPAEWSIYINPNKAFTYDKGEMRIEHLAKEHDSQVSVTVTWEKVLNQEDGFAGRYLENLEAQYKKTLKKSKRYELISKREIIHNDHEACIVHSVLSANTHAIRALGKNVNLEILQMALYCSDSKRIVVASSTCTSNYFSEHKDKLETILMSLTCHRD